MSASFHQQQRDHKRDLCTFPLPSASADHVSLQSPTLPSHPLAPTTLITRVNDDDGYFINGKAMRMA